MQRQPDFLNCPAHLSSDGAVRCGLPAEVEVRYTMESTDGPLESAKIRCPRGHHFNGPIESLTVPEQPAAARQISWPAEDFVETAESLVRPTGRGRGR